MVLVMWAKNIIERKKVIDNNMDDKLSDSKFHGIIHHAKNICNIKAMWASNPKPLIFPVCFGNTICISNKDKISDPNVGAVKMPFVKNPPKISDSKYRIYSLERNNILSVLINESSIKVIKKAPPPIIDSAVLVSDIALLSLLTSDCALWRSAGNEPIRLR